MQSSPKIETFLVAHGGWSADGRGKRCICAAGHGWSRPPTRDWMNGSNLASPSNDLETHVEDLLAVIKYQDLNDVLIGHS